MLDGIKAVVYWVGLIGGILFVLFVIGTINNKGTHGMAAVGAGFGDVIRWGGDLVSQLLSHL